MKFYIIFISFILLFVGFIIQIYSLLTPPSMRQHQQPLQQAPSKAKARSAGQLLIIRKFPILLNDAQVPALFLVHCLEELNWVVLSSHLRPKGILCLVDDSFLLVHPGIL